VYAAEWPDNAGGHVRNLLLPDDAPLASEWRGDLLNGVDVVKAKALALSYDRDRRVSRHEQEVTLIPYYAWANRGPGEMTVFIPNRDSVARPQPLPTLALRARVSSSAGGRQPRAVQDQDEPRSSSDPSFGFFHWWPKKGTTEWIQYDFAGGPATVGAAAVYWADDTGSGEVRAPASWRLLYRDGEEWKPVAPAAGEAFGTALDRYNRVAFQPVTTRALRVEAMLSPQSSAGIQEWTVE
jgi:hypothetical protein